MNRSGPISQVEVEEEILRLTQMLEDETENYAILIEDAAKKEARLKGEWAAAYLNHQGSIKERESWADYQLADKSFEWKIAEALAKASKEKLNFARTSIDALRTLAANVRAQT